LQEGEEKARAIASKKIAEVRRKTGSFLKKCSTKSSSLILGFSLTLNGLHSPWADTFMYWITQRNTWIPLYALLIIWLIWQYKQQAAGMIASLILTIVVADQTASTLLKPWVERLRPCYVTYLQNKVHLVVESCGGTYGFASSHAANSFGFAMALWLLCGTVVPTVNIPQKNQSSIIIKNTCGGFFHGLRWFLTVAFM
jgi:hypothetical protein